MSEKYRQFRNYMTNELGITRQDIEAWAKQSVATEVDKALKRIDVEKRLNTAIDAVLRDLTRQALGTERWSLLQDMRQAIGKKVADNLEIEIRPKPQQEQSDG